MSQIEPRRPRPSSQSQLPAIGGKAGRIERSAANQAHDIRLQRYVGEARANTLTHVGLRALECQAVISTTERMLVEIEPGAINGIAHLSKRLTMGLGRCIDQTIADVVER